MIPYLFNKTNCYIQFIYDELLIKSVKLFALIFILSIFGNKTNAQTLTLSKTTSDLTPNDGSPFSYIINAACNSSTQDCESVTITDALPDELEFINFSSPLPDGIDQATYDINSHSVTVTFDATSCASCTPDGINTDEDDFAQGSSIQISVQVRFPIGTFAGTTADNTACANSVNAGNPCDSAPTVTSTGGPTPQTGCNQMVYDVSSSYNVLVGGQAYIKVQIANDGFADINNWHSITTFPADYDFTELYTPYLPGVNHSGTITYERSDQPGVWHNWHSFNVNSEDRIYESALGLPAGVTVSALRIDMGTLSGDGTWNLNTIIQDWEAGFRMYGDVNPAYTGTTIDFCSFISGDIGGLTCSNTACSTTNIDPGGAYLDGGKDIIDDNRNEIYTLSPGDTFSVELHFASAQINNLNVEGAVMVDVLPPGMTYIPGSWRVAWDFTHITTFDPVVQTGYTIDGRQWVRFVYDDSLGNPLTIIPDGGWHGIGLIFQVEISQGVTPGIHTNEYYWTATDSDHGCDNGQNSGGLIHLGGYGYDDNYCDDTADLEVIFPPGSSGLVSYKEVKGTLNANYNRYPNYGTTVPGGLNDYILTITNPNATPIDDIVIIDIFPYVGDTEVLNNSVPRQSQWRPNLLAPITAPAGTTLYYTTVTNPCRDEVAGPTDPLPYPTGCTPASWSTSEPADITDVTGIKLDLGTTVLNQNDIFSLSWEMRAPVNAPTGGEIAWNSFAYIGSNANTSDPLLPAEPIKVGIESFPGSVPIAGDFVWIDSNGNGIQDAGETGQDGVTVILYQDNGDGIPNTATDTEVARTVTANNGQYLFSNFPLGNYFIEFTNLPLGYNETHTDIGGDDNIDSDGLITSIQNFGSTSDIRNIDLGIYNGTPPCNSNISLSYNIGPCIDQPLADIATMELTVSWVNAPGFNNDTIVVEIGGTRYEILDIGPSTTSPIIIDLNIPANGLANDVVSAHWLHWENCGNTSATFNHPNSCSNDELSCDILYLCGEEKLFDGDAWDHGFIEYLQANNGSNTLLPVLTKDEPGVGTYDPMNPTTFVNVNFSNYDLIIISATTEDHISADLVNAIRDFNGGILLSNYLLQDDLGYTNGSNEDVVWSTDAFINDTQSENILTYNNVNPWSGYLMSHGDYEPNADGYLWAANGNASSNQNGIIYHYEDTDAMPGVGTHGSRVYLGYHMNGIYGNDVNMGIVPSDPNGWFDPVAHLSTIGKSLFDQALLLAGAGCATNGTCYDITNPYPGFTIDFDNNNCSWIDYYLGSDLQLTDNGDGTMNISGSIANGHDATWDACVSTTCGLNDGWTLNLTLSDRMDWATFQAGGGTANLNANCSGMETGLDYWDVSGTLTGTGCNAGQTLNINGPSGTYRLQIGYGANSGDPNCSFGISTWFDIDDGTNPMKADIYGFLDENCYNPSEEECKIIYTNRFVSYRRP